MPVPAAAPSWYERLVLMSTRPLSTDFAILAAAALVDADGDPLEEPFEGVVEGIVKFPKPGKSELEFDVVGEVIPAFDEVKT
jgi:hypothetical protein